VAHRASREDIDKVDIKSTIKGRPSLICFKTDALIALEAALSFLYKYPKTGMYVSELTCYCSVIVFETSARGSTRKHLALVLNAKQTKKLASARARMRSGNQMRTSLVCRNIRS
jgi:hypothetical protein